MSQYLNQTMLIGNLGADPTMRFAPNGSPVTTFDIAVTRKFNNKDGEAKEETNWFSIVCWNKIAELCNQYLEKGSGVFVQGRLQNRSWNGQDGQKHYKTEVIANQVIFMGGKKSSEHTEPSVPEEESSGDITPEQIPF